MLTTTFERGRQGAHELFSIERVADPGRLRALLSEDSAYCAYAIAQLEPARFARSAWYVASTTGDRRGLVMHSSSGLGNALFTYGDAAAVDAILRLHPGSRFSFGSLQPEHRRVVERYFVITRPAPMLRMYVTRESFRPIEGEAFRLRGGDVDVLNRLYAAEGSATNYRPSHLEDGVYWGVRQEGRLVAVAGTHVVSPAEGVAVVGNVFTHPRYRNRGHSTVATSAATAELLERCPLIVLTVEAANEPARAVYRRLGYQPACPLHESPLIRKEPLGLISLSRRLAATWRGRGEGKELVRR